MPGVQLTTLLHRLGRARGLLGTPHLPDPGDLRGLPDLRDETATRVRALLPAVDRERFDGLVGDRPDAVVLRRTLAAWWSVDVVAAVTTALDRAEPSVRAAVGDPVVALAREGRQSDGTTCGSAVLTMLAAAGDPVLALWLASGTVLGSARPVELSGASDAALARFAGVPVDVRFAAVHRVLRRRTSRRAVLGLPWPPRYGTPPWTAARTARFVGVRYHPLVLDDTDRAHLDAVLGRVQHAVARGVPVPLYTGGDSARGWDTAVPRHVVLAVGHGPSGFDVWEPGAGRIVAAGRSALLEGGRHPALGGWDHLVWALLPRV